MCYISMSGDDGYSPEVVHESTVDDEMRFTSVTCPRCKALNVELDAELDTYFNDEEAGFSETIRY